MLSRRILPIIEADLKKKMVILAGPRQCGKTTLSKIILNTTPGTYMNWDDSRTRIKIQKGDLDFDAKLWIFDELHKFRKWRNFLKGLYDLNHETHQIFVTGSARLEAFSRGGDSLQGRYFSHRLHPITFSELENLSAVKIDEFPLFPNSPREGSEAILDDLMTLGGFPEPLLSGSLKEANRWRLAYGTRLVQEEIRTLQGIRDLDRLELLYDQLSEVAGSIVSINSLREDLEVAFETVRAWIQVFERFYSIFRISPFGASKIKAVKKEQKLYFWDWSRAVQPGARFENLIALHLLRWVHWLEDVEGEKIDLRFFRTREGHEVDFILLRNKKPWIAVEVKLSDSELSPSLKYFLERFPTKHAFQVYLKNGKEKRWPDIHGCEVRTVSAARLLANLP
jgi:predicted AAA+ superfamily ATPase